MLAKRWENSRALENLEIKGSWKRWINEKIFGERNLQSKIIFEIEIKYGEEVTIREWY